MLRRWPTPLLLWCLLVSIPVLAAEPEVNGRLETIEGVRVLHVGGTPQQMGFAHGYLVGDGVVDYLEESVATMPPNQRAAFDHIEEATLGFIDMPETATAELGALLAGIQTANDGTLPMIKGLGRPLRLEDLLYLNAGDAIRFGCSGFTVWGEQAGDAGVITTRNFDYPMPGPKSLANQLIIVRAPAGQHKVASVAIPGYIGTFTGINEFGVCAFMHDGTGPRPAAPRGRYTPAGWVLAEMLSRSKPADAHDRTRKMLAGIAPYSFSYMIRVVGPRVPGSGNPPGRVFRLDAEGVSENPARPTHCITTNHYIDADFSPSDRADAWSMTRYQRLRKRLASTVTPDTAWASLDEVASDSQRFPTLHAVVVYPEKRALDIALAAWKEGRVIAAPKGKPVRITFDRLFGDGD